MTAEADQLMKELAYLLKLFPGSDIRDFRADGTRLHFRCRAYGFCTITGRVNLATKKKLPLFPLTNFPLVLS
jgi:hypothetical protein